MANSQVNFSKLKILFNNMDSEKKILGLSLIKETEFMKKTLTKLKKETDSKGVVVEMSQGKYVIERSNPAIASYNTMMKNYQSTIKQLYDMLPENINPDEDDFDEFNK